MKKSIGIFALGLLGITSSWAQVEFIATAGTSHFLGDLGGKPNLGSNDVSDLNLLSTRYMTGLGMRVNLGNSFAAKATGFYARVSANDKYTQNVERNMRNLNFFSPIMGAEAVVEFKFGNGTQAFDDKNWFIYAGAGYFTFNPKTEYQGEKVELQPLGTEGQFYLDGKSPYKRNSWSIPFGIGYKVKSTNSGYLSIQIESRKTFTDYIDDVSTKFADKNLLLASNGQMAVDLSDRSNPEGRIIGFSDPGTIRGNPNNNDNFFFLTVSYNWVLGNNHSGNNFYNGRHVKHRKRRGPTSGDGF